VLRWTLRIVLGAIALAVVTVIAVVIALHTEWGRELVRRKAEAALAGAFPGSKIARVEPALFGTTTVHGLVIAGAGGAPMVKVDTIEAEVSLRPLLGKTVHVDRLWIDGVVVAAGVTPEKKPAPEKPEPPGEPTAWSLEFADVSVEHAKVIGKDGAPIADGIEVDAVAALPAGGAMLARATVGANWRGKQVVASAALRRAGELLEVPLATVKITGDSVVGVPSESHEAGKAGTRVESTLDVLGATYDGVRFNGFVLGRGAAATLKELAGVELAGDVGLIAETHPDGSIDVTANVADAWLHALVAVDPAAMRARATVLASVPDAASLVRDAPAGGGSVFATIDADRDHAAGVIHARGTRGEHSGAAVIAVDATRAGAWVEISTTSDIGMARTTTIATLKRTGDVIDLAQATVTGRAGRVELAIGGPSATAPGPAPIVVHAAAPAKTLAVGASTVNLVARGRVWPDADVRVDGEVDARDFAFDKTSADGVRVRLDNVHALATGVRGATQIAVTQARQAGKPYGSLDLAAHYSASRDGTVTVDLDSHNFKSAVAGVWSGAGGHLAIGERTIELRGFHTGNGIGKVDADGTLERASGDLSAKVDARGFTLAMVSPGTGGVVGGTATIARKHGRWDGTVAYTGRGIALPDRPVVDSSGTLTIHGRKLTLDTTSSSATIGTVHVTSEIETPFDPTNAVAWKRSERSAIHSIAVTLGNIQLAGASDKISGTVDGKAEITATGADGTIHLRGLHTKEADVDADVTLGPDEHGHIVATLGAKLVGIADLTGDGELALPQHPFDPAEWSALGRDALAGGEIHAKDVPVEPETLARFGVKSPYHARIDVDAELATGATSLTAGLAVRNIHGGALQKSVDFAASATLDETGARATASAHSGPTTLFAAQLTSPITIDALRTQPITTAALTGIVAVTPATADAPVAGAPVTVGSVHDLLAIVGRDDILAGTLGGTIDVGGSVGAPTAHAVLTAKDLAIRASVEGRPPAQLKDLALDARWAADTGSLDVLAHEADNGLLHVSASGSPKALAAVQGGIEAKAFDLAPLAAFAPGAIGASKGVLEANLTLVGIDPDTGDLRGKFHLHEARVPLAAMIGTLRNGDIDAVIADHEIDAKVNGKLGKGDVKGAVAVKLNGSTPASADAEFDLKTISLIRAHQPVIDAHVEAHMKHTTRWNGEIEIGHAHVLIPSSGGHKLLESSTPSDLVFADAPPKTEPYKREPPSRPWLVANVTLLPTDLDVQDDQFQVAGRASGKLKLSVGTDSIGAEGKIEAERGDIQLFEQRSQLDHGDVIFDGGLDPILDVRVSRELDTMVVSIDVSGRASAYLITFSSDTGSYSQGDLLAFFIGGSTGSDTDAAGQAATQAGAGIASNILSKNIKRFQKLLPGALQIDLNTHYIAATSANSEALAVGHQLSRDTYVEYRNHPEARPDENNNEGILEYRIRNTEWRLRGEIGDRTYDSGEIEHRWHW
jgi:hypothetical protein